MITDLLRSPLKLFASEVSAAPNKMVQDGESTNMRDRIDAFATIPGMLPLDRGTILYCLAYAQNVRGDVIEIGSWQGRSTCFLAQACRDSDNGVVRAIDHFKGNVGSEAHYVIDRPDLSDLEGNFKCNVSNAGLSGQVKLYNMPSDEAVERHTGDFRRIRMLFIDGDHSYEGARRDIELFAPLLPPNGLIVFDDYHSDGPGVVQAVRECIFDTNEYDHAIQFPGVLIARKIDKKEASL